MQRPSVGPSECRAHINSITVSLAPLVQKKAGRLVDQKIPKGTSAGCNIAILYVMLMLKYAHGRLGVRQLAAATMAGDSTPSVLLAVVAAVLGEDITVHWK